MPGDHKSFHYSMPGDHKSSASAGRSWRILRVALLCARKGSAVKSRIVADIRRGVSRLKSLRAQRNCHSYRLHYGEHELSLDDTPTFRFKKCGRWRFFPCIDPPLVSFDDDDDNEGTSVRIDEEYVVVDDGNAGSDEEEKGIDSKAEEFISRFYEDMKLQRQVSFVRYNEMMYRGMS